MQTPTEPSPLTHLPRWVIDTNWALDLLVFEDPRAASLRERLTSKQWQWLTCAPMHAELERVLGYPNIVRQLERRALPAETVMAEYERLTVAMGIPPACPISCRDPDDQVFIDLAVQHGAHLLSKDTEVLRLRQKLKTAYSIVVAQNTPDF